jgi:hypothetical protein
MEQSTNSVTSKITSNLFQKFIGVCMTIVTLCATLMVTFVWDLRSDFSAEKQKQENTQSQVSEIKTTVADDGRRLNNLEKVTDNHDFRLNTLEQKKR